MKKQKRQLPLPMFIPKPYHTPLWVSLLTHYLQEVSGQEKWLTNPRVWKMARELRKMCYDDAWVSGPWSVEYLNLAKGFTHYRVYHQGKFFGQVDVRSANSLPVIQQRLAVFLVHMGFEKRIYSAAKTDLDAGTNRLNRLFTKEAS